MRSNYAGVDWASEKHDVLVADAAGEKLLAATFAHDEAGCASRCAGRSCACEVELVAIERPDGLLVERLLDAGLRILPLHPNQVAATRDRFRASGGKSDRFDAFVLCELARTDHHRFRVLEPDSDQTKALRALTRAREDLVGTRTALINQLRAELERFWPGPLGLFTDLHSRISLAFLERYPSPADARGLGEARLQGFLAREHYTGRQQPAQLLAKLRRAPEARVGELELGHPPPTGAEPGRDDQDDQRADQAVRAPDRDRHPRASRRSDLPVAVQESQQRDLRRGAVGGDRRLPRALPNPRHARRRRRPGRRRQGVRQIQSRHLPLGLQQAPTRGGRARSRTAPATTTPGPRTSTPAPATAGTTTPARSAPSDAPGAASSGAAGRTACRMTRPATAPCSSTSRSPSRPCQGPSSTMPQPSAWPPAPSPPPRPPESKR